MLVKLVGWPFKAASPLLKRLFYFWPGIFLVLIPRAAYLRGDRGWSGRRCRGPPVRWPWWWWRDWGVRRVCDTATSRTGTVATSCQSPCSCRWPDCRVCGRRTEDSGTSVRTFCRATATASRCRSARPVPTSPTRRATPASPPAPTASTSSCWRCAGRSGRTPGGDAWRRRRGAASTWPSLLCRRRRWRSRARSVAAASLCPTPTPSTPRRRRRWPGPAASPRSTDPAGSAAPRTSAGIRCCHRCCCCCCCDCCCCCCDCCCCCCGCWNRRGADRRRCCGRTPAPRATRRPPERPTPSASGTAPSSQFWDADFLLVPSNRRPSNSFDVSSFSRFLLLCCVRSLKRLDRTTWSRVRFLFDCQSTLESMSSLVARVDGLPLLFLVLVVGTEWTEQKKTRRICWRRNTFLFSFPTGSTAGRSLVFQKEASFSTKKKHNSAVIYQSVFLLLSVSRLVGLFKAVVHTTKIRERERETKTAHLRTAKKCHTTRRQKLFLSSFFFSFFSYRWGSWVLRVCAGIRIGRVQTGLGLSLFFFVTFLLLSCGGRKKKWGEGGIRVEKEEEDEGVGGWWGGGGGGEGCALGKERLANGRPDGGRLTHSGGLRVE